MPSPLAFCATNASNSGSFTSLFANVISLFASVKHPSRETLSKTASLRTRAIQSRRFHQPDNMIVRIAEERNCGTVRNLIGTHHAVAAGFFDRSQRRLDVGHADVKRHMSAVAFGRLADAAVDAALVVN